MSNTTAKTIIQQINGLDPMAFSAWGTSALTSFSCSEDDLGSLRFTVRNCSNFKGTAFIKVTLDFNDTYTVRLYKHRNHTKALKAKMLADEFVYTEDEFINVLAQESGVYFDQLVDTIDRIVGEK
jgi:hypothetical protein